MHELRGYEPLVLNFDNCRDNEYNRLVFIERPLLGALLFKNEASDARDHCANERTFLSWMRLAVYMAVVSIAIILSFHLKNKPTDIGKSLLSFQLIDIVLGMKVY
jgi:uncharacterized membrane protein YidH (DUF202 family)